MTDKQWLDKLTKCRKYFDKYYFLLNECEEEYIKRFGKTPSDLEDDVWVDMVHWGKGEISISDIEESANIQIQSGY